MDLVELYCLVIYFCRDAWFCVVHGGNTMTNVSSRCYKFISSTTKLLGNKERHVWIRVITCARCAPLEHTHDNHHLQRIRR